MEQTGPFEVIRVSPSMIRSVFAELKANGYSDQQIKALSAGLIQMADKRKNNSPERSEDFGARCATGLPHQL